MAEPARVAGQVFNVGGNDQNLPVQAIAELVRGALPIPVRIEAVPADAPLRELGLDSLMTVELRNALAARHQLQRFVAGLYLLQKRSGIELAPRAPHHGRDARGIARAGASGAA